ncbi:MAG: hypothetical protein M1134_01935 [Actinobacteria bacterium]|nr:hypothetical protein [Actinomycetota bacterium]MCL5444689.1 hypothetical protein [Actinomycetota bacterium]
MALHRHVNAAASLLTAALALGIVLAACGYSGPAHDRYGNPLGPITLKEMESNPLSHLYYPGSHVFYRDGLGSNDGANSVGPAFAGAILTSNATGAQIYSWYIKTLAKKGWYFVTDGGCPQTQVTCPQFSEKGHGIRPGFMIAIDDPTALRDVIGKSPPPACTVYEMQYQMFPPGGVSVPGALTWDGGHSCWWTNGHWSVPVGTPRLLPGP